MSTPKRALNLAKRRGLRPPTLRKRCPESALVAITERTKRNREHVILITLDQAAFEVISREQARLHSGIMTAHVPESAAGFRVETPTLQVIVIHLGTAFGVSVSDDGLTNVSVFEGEVEVNPQADNLL